MDSTDDAVADELGVVDVVAIHEEENVCVLGMVDLLSWGDHARIKTLQERLNAYVAYWDSGQLLADFPAARYASIRITVFFRHEPDAEGEAFLELTAANIQTLGIAFDHQLLAD